MSAIVDGNAKYKAVKLIRVTWDTFKDAPIARELNVSRRSTLVMFTGGKEVGRVVSQTSKGPIEALFKAAV